jgi:hypothetical protein
LQFLELLAQKQGERPIQFVNMAGYISSITMQAI